MSNRLDKEREAALQPERIEHAVKKITELGFEIIYRDETRIDFMFKGSKIQFYPYSGWHTGATIKDGRGINNLLSQIKK